MIECNWTDEECDDHVLGSGADQLEWYIENIYVEHFNIDNDTVRSLYYARMYHEGSADPEDAAWFTFTRDDVRREVTKILNDTHPHIKRGSLYGSYFVKDDPDACAMDSLIQSIVYDGIVYG